MNILAFDIGGTNVKAAVVEWEDGRVRRVHADYAPSGATADEALATAVDLGRRRLELYPDCEAAGLCVPGIVDNGVVVSLPGKLAGMEGRDLPGWLAATFGLRVGPIVNDAVAAGVAGAFFAHQTLLATGRILTVTIGTGIGTAVIDPLQPVGSGPLDNGILGGAVRLGGLSIEELCRASALAGPFPSPVELYEAYDGGDPAAAALVERYREALADGLAALAHAHTPTVIVLGGSPLSRHSPVADGLEAMVNERLFAGYSVRVEVSPSASTMGVHGVALLAVGRPAP